MIRVQAEGNGARWPRAETARKWRRTFGAGKASRSECKIIRRGDAEDHGYRALLFWLSMDEFGLGAGCPRIVLQGEVDPIRDGRMRVEPEYSEA